jgi:hypothetical protein
MCEAPGAALRKLRLALIGPSVLGLVENPLGGVGDQPIFTLGSRGETSLRGITVLRARVMDVYVVDTLAVLVTILAVRDRGVRPGGIISGLSREACRKCPGVDEAHVGASSGVRATVKAVVADYPVHAVDNVVASAAEQVVSTRAAMYVIVARIAKHVILARSAVDVVIAPVAANLVGTATAR